VPRGPILGISPFNFPLNLVAHKIAPAIAVGAPIVLKPAPATPLSALLLGELLAETELPAGMFSILPVPNDRAGALVADPRLPVVSFTGSGPVGAQIRAAVPHKHVTLELGGNAAAVVCGDWASDGDLEWAATRIATFGNYQAGQSCIAVQRVIVHTGQYDALAERLVAKVGALRTGDPYDPDTDVGPLISADAADRVVAWVNDAVDAGAKPLTAVARQGASIAPIVLERAPHEAKVWADEVFGPVLVLDRVDSDEEAFAAVNDSAYGLQAGVFTHNLQTAFTAHRTLKVGGVIIGDVPSYRADQMPYGGVKGSGVGREGVRSAMDDYTEPRVMVLTNLAL
jgi:acyl-CoA reductase-like NAD-dependent aldehyde dehydrogenase